MAFIDGIRLRVIEYIEWLWRVRDRVKTTQGGIESFADKIAKVISSECK